MADTEVTFDPAQAVNASAWLDHAMVLHAIRNDRSGERLRRYAVEARLQRATSLAAELQVMADERASTPK